MERALTIMLEAAKEQTNVLTAPAPSVIFNAFGNSSISLKLRCFVPDIKYRQSTIMELHKLINRKFNDAGLVIAFPQMDVHLGTDTPLNIQMQNNQST